MKLSNRTISLLCAAAIITCSMPAFAQSPGTGLRIEAGALGGEPAIARGAEQWEVVTGDDFFV